MRIKEILRKHGVPLTETTTAKLAGVLAVSESTIKRGMGLEDFLKLADHYGLSRVQTLCDLGVLDLSDVHASVAAAEPSVRLASDSTLLRELLRRSEGNQGRPIDV